MDDKKLEGNASRQVVDVHFRGKKLQCYPVDNCTEALTGRTTSLQTPTISNRSAQKDSSNV